MDYRLEFIVKKSKTYIMYVYKILVNMRYIIYLYVTIQKDAYFCPIQKLTFDPSVAEE